MKAILALLLAFLVVSSSARAVGAAAADGPFPARIDEVEVVAPTRTRRRRRLGTKASCRALCRVRRNERRTCIRQCKTKNAKSQVRACRRACWPSKDEVESCFARCGGSSSNKCFDSGNTKYDELSCTIVSTFNDCYPTAISGIWPVDPNGIPGQPGTVCEISQVFTTYCVEEKPSRTVSLRAEGDIQGDCDTIQSPINLPVSLEIDVKLPDWRLYADVDFVKSKCTCGADGSLYSK